MVQTILKTGGGKSNEKISDAIDDGVSAGLDSPGGFGV
jgi:hypothetical protein